MMRREGNMVGTFHLGITKGGGREEALDHIHCPSSLTYESGKELSYCNKETQNSQDLTEGEMNFSLK